MSEPILAADNPEEQGSICLVKCTKPVQCKGPCHKHFCLKCAAQAKCSSDRCPHRCSTPFQVQPVSLPPRCPYNPQECIIAISTEKDLQSHHLICPHVSEENRKSIDNKLNYRCKKGHQLTFLPKEACEVLYGKFWTLGHEDCAGCGVSELCRTICVSCSLKEKKEFYCAECRVPPCSKEKCPMGHKFKHRNKPGKARFCDFCDVPAGLMNNRVHGFCPCDFDLCELCYQKLPDHHELIPLKCNPQKLWPLSRVEEDSEDSDWK